MTNFAERYFGIRAQERSRAFLMLGYYFVCASTMVLVDMTSSALFLTRFADSNLMGFQGVRALPLLWIVSGLVVVPAVSLVRSRIGSGFGSGRQPSAVWIILGSTAFLGVLILAFRLAFGIASARESWIIAFPLFLIAAEVVFTLITLNMETAANQLFNIREAKRVFGFIGGGTVIADIVAGFAVTGLVRVLPSVADLLYLILALIAASGAMFAVIARRYRHAFTPSDASGAGDSEEPPAPLWKSRYVLLITAFVLASQLAYYFVDYQFKTAAEARFIGREEELASFFGLLFGALGFVKLFIQLFVTNRVLARFGIFGALLVLPVGLAVAGGVTAANVGALFALLCVVKGLDNTFRWTFISSAQPLLYQALPDGIARRAQNAITGAIDPVSVGLSSVVLIAVTTSLVSRESIHLLSFGLVGIAAGWLVVVWRLKRSYLSTLVESTQRRRVQVALDVSDPTLVAELFRYLRNGSPVQVLSAARILERFRPEGFFDQLVPLMEHPSSEIQAMALDLLALRPGASSDELIEAVAARLPGPAHTAAPACFDIAVQASAVRTYCLLMTEAAVDDVTHLLSHPLLPLRAAAVEGCLLAGGIEGILAAGPVLRRMLNHSSEDERVAACRIIASSNLRPLYRPMVALIRDSDPVVSREAIRRAGQVGELRLIPAIIDALGDPDAWDDAVTTLSSSIGIPAVEMLRNRVSDPGSTVLLRRHAARALSQIDAEPAVYALVEALDVCHEVVHAEVLEALAFVRQRGGLSTSPPMREALRRVIEGLYTTIRLAAPSDPRPELRYLSSALSDRLRAGRQRVLTCLQLVYPVDAVGSAEQYLSSESPALRAKGLELLDTILDDEHRSDVVTAFDDIDPARQIEHGESRFDLPEATIDALLTDVLRADDVTYSAWMVAVCIRTAVLTGAPLPSAYLTSIAKSNRADVAREEAIRAAFHQGSQDAISELKEAAIADHSLPGITLRSLLSGDGSMLSTLDKVMFLKSVSLFASVRDERLLEVAVRSREERFTASRPILRKDEIGDSMYVVVSGRVAVHIGDQELVQLGERAFFGEMAVIDAEPRSADVTAVQDTITLRIGQKDLTSAMALEPDIARGVMRELSRRVRAQNELIQRARFRDALTSAWLDGSVDQDEQSVLDQLRESLKVSEEHACEIADEVRQKMERYQIASR
ncbi:cyclic nucleotide-binding domain-containing protein [Candidatus Poribacteria bacterium]|nr:cyclic nucleotide-binding domain-containing protein [Candidatus Poribacteria bacterium]